MQLSQLNFTELAGSEQAVNNSASEFQNLKQTPIHEFVAKSFNSLSCHLMRTIQRKKKTASSPITDDTETKLVACLRQGMSPESSVLLLSCVDPAPQMVEHCLPALKFCASLREQINKKWKKLLEGTKKVSSKKKSSIMQDTIELHNLLLSQLKASEKIMAEIKSKLYDQHESESVSELTHYSHSLSELITDFDTLLTVSSMNKTNLS